MECFLHASTNVVFGRAIQRQTWKSNTNRRLRAKVNDEKDPLLQSAMNAASLRYQETHRQEPLLLDPYAGCFTANEGVDLDINQSSVNYYALTTKLIDDKLLNTVNQIDGLKQVVMLTDGMDTRPYRLSWPKSTMMFDISPDDIFKTAAEKLQGVGAKVPRGCMFHHVALGSSCMQQSLRAKGFNGNLPSVWAIQGLPLTSLSSFEEILAVVSSLAANGCFFLGELPASLAETEIDSQASTRQWVEKLFLSNGFRVNLINLEKLATSLGKSLVPEICNNLLFVAEQLQFSDDQMEKWRSEFQRVEEEADEEGFEEL